MKFDRESQINTMLDAAIASFDIPDWQFELAVSRYEGLGHFLMGRAKQCGRNRDVYPQGSFRLGTVVRSIGGSDQYDIDMVDKHDVCKSSVSQAQLKVDVGGDLSRFIASAPDGAPKIKEGKRCWTLDYSLDRFHIDVLPAIPDDDGARDAILLTDKDLRNWQHSNPIGYSWWFRRQMAREFDRMRKEAASVLALRNVEDVPDWRVKTTLQRAVQALKRHRDLYFLNNTGNKPASIVITTLAAMSFPGHGTLHEVLVSVTKQMPDHLHNRDGVIWLPNPVHPEENFTDRWLGKPELASAFFRWIKQAHVDFAGIGEGQGLDRGLEAIRNGLGDGPARAAGESLGGLVATGSRLGGLGLGSTAGILSTRPRRPARQHTFHGSDATPRPN